MPMASSEGDDVVEATVEDQEEEQEDQGEEKDVNEPDESSTEQNEDEQKEQESENEVEFLGSVEGSNGHESEEDADTVVVEQQERSRANTNALMAANGLVTPATLEAEFQCIICQYALFKPVTVFCGHSFCRVCLMDSFLTRSMEEAQCPICRVEILQPLAATSSPSEIFNINVILWNAIQLLIPAVAARISSYQQEEEEEYTRKLDQLDAKWKIFFLTERAERYHGDHDEEDVASLNQSLRTGDEASRWEEEYDDHSEYPVLKVEDSEDGNLHVSRNIVLDTSDANEDGIMNMRIGFAIVEFPSIFELYNEHQECSLNVIKMEEDEEMADGMPFFMSENGEDDVLVCNSYYNHITLRVCDDGGNCVMERTRAAQSGVVDFPGLRLDVPGGMYTFRFSDDLYGLKLSIAMQLRELHETSDAPVAGYISLVTDEAGDARRLNRGRSSGHSDDEGDYDEDGNDSDDSFIVDDLGGEEPIGHFSDDEGENHYSYHSDDEVADERRERRRRRRRGHSARRSNRDVEFVEEHEDEGDSSGDEAGHEENEGDDAGDHEEEDNDDGEFVQQGRRNVQLIEEDDDEEHHESHEISRSRRRNANHILDSEDEDEVGGSGSDEITDLNENAEHDSAVLEENGMAESEDNADADIDIEDEEQDAADENEDEAVNSEVPGRKVKRDQWEEDEESDEEDSLAQQGDGESESEVAERRPLKRARDRNVRIVDEGESDDETAEMERSIMTAVSLNGDATHDDEADEDVGNFQQTHPFYENETDEQHVYDDARQDENDVNPDYPDEDEDEEDRYQEEEDDYTGEFSE